MRVNDKYFNILLASYIFLLFHSPKGSWNKLEKYQKLICHIALSTVQ